jgi:hypothetical protein
MIFSILLLFIYLCCFRERREGGYVLRNEKEKDDAGRQAHTYHPIEKHFLRFLLEERTRENRVCVFIVLIYISTNVSSFLSSFQVSLRAEEVTTLYSQNFQLI